MKRSLIVLLLLCLAGGGIGRAADHNDPNSVNSIFSDVPVSAADLYDMFGWPSDDKSRRRERRARAHLRLRPEGRRVRPPTCSTACASTPIRASAAGSRRGSRPSAAATATRWRRKYLQLEGAEVRVRADGGRQGARRLHRLPRRQLLADRST